MAGKRSEAKSTTKPAARKPVVRRKRAAAASHAITHEDIATRAYYIHLEGGHDPIENWIRAERELAA